MEENQKENGIRLKQVPENMKFVPPVEIISQLMKKKSGELKDLKSNYEKELEGNDKTFSQLAVQVFSLNKILDRYGAKLQESGLKPLFDELRITRNKLTQALESGGITVEDLTGKEMDDSALELAEVIGWRPDDREKEHVMETYEPLIKHGEVIIHTAKVIGGTRSLVKEESVEENTDKASESNAEGGKSGGNTEINSNLEEESSNEDK